MKHRLGSDRFGTDLGLLDGDEMCGLGLGLLGNALLDGSLDIVERVLDDGRGLHVRHQRLEDVKPGGGVKKKGAAGSVRNGPC